MQGKMISQFRSGSLLILVTALALTMLACTSANSSSVGDSTTPSQAISTNFDCGADSPTSSKSNLSVEPGPTSQMAAEISANAGKVIAAANGSSDRKVVVFEETHTSRVGQLEIALMLLRLHDKHNLRQISLEGAIADQGELPAQWFRNLPNSPNAVQAKERTAVRLLSEGEISSAEFIALTLPDVRVKGNEKAEEYNVTMADKSSSAPLGYLLAIVEKSATPSQIQRANQLIKAGKQKEAIAFLFQADSWVSERYKKLTSKSSGQSSEELIALYQEIEAKATAVGAQLDSEARSGMRDTMNFFKTASKRSCTMVRNTLAMFDAAPKSPVALIVGAAHTAKVVELLKASKVSYAVVSPNSLAEGSERGALSLLAYDRKLEQKSVDAPGLLGTYLKGRRKPTTVLGKQWFQSKSETYIAIRLLAAAAAGGKKLPSQDLDNELKAFAAIKIDPSSYQVVKVGNQSRVIFKVTARIDDTDPSRTVDLWVGGWKEPPGPPSENQLGFKDPDDGEKPVSLEDMVREALERVKQEGEPSKTEASPAKPPVLLISKNFKAVFAATPNAALDAVRSD